MVSKLVFTVAALSIPIGVSEPTSKDVEVQASKVEVKSADRTSCPPPRGPPGPPWRTRWRGGAPCGNSPEPH